MKLTISQLRRIIKEEVQNVMEGPAQFQFKNGDIVTWNGKSWMVLHVKDRDVTLVEPGNPKVIAHADVDEVEKSGPWR